MLIDLLTKKYPGMRQWLAQRLSAVVMAIYSVVFFSILLLTQPQSYAEWHAMFAPVWWRVFTFLFFLCLVMHAWLGVRDVLRDYIFNADLRDYLQLAVDIFLILYLLWAMKILWDMG
jgi:succinate dehydrogenase membrane anchor subunit